MKSKVPRLPGSTLVSFNVERMRLLAVGKFKVLSNSGSLLSLRTVFLSQALLPMFSRVRVYFLIWLGWSWV